MYALIMDWRITDPGICSNT